ncbi:MAG TPA: Zn-ribbon domain-containing OB-fold protein [Dehalococcoidia bacterium]|nr:Zn-ribbon domain-containing OB-fold protein [Dehalococcoidia bacterium]
MLKLPLKIVNEDPLVLQGKIYLDYAYYVGPIATRFFTDLRDRGKFFGIRCGECGITYMPPRGTCGRCFGKLEEWVEVAPQGTVISHTITYYPSVCHPVKEPIVYAIVKLDGADTGLIHMLGDVEPSEAYSGMRVEAVFKEKREGNILDIKYFKPLR